MADVVVQLLPLPIALGIIMGYGGPPVNRIVNLNPLPIAMDIKVSPLGEVGISGNHGYPSFSPIVHARQVGCTLGIKPVSIVIDEGNSITRNSGYIFTENSFTSNQTDAELASLVNGMPFTITRALRSGIPYWKSVPYLQTFARQKIGRAHV